MATLAAHTRADPFVRLLASFALLGLVRRHESYACVSLAHIVSDNLTTYKPGYASAALGTRNCHGAGHHAVPCRGPDDRHDVVHPP